MNNDGAKKPTAPAKPSLSALTAAALALPGLAPAQVETDLLYSRYQEADLPGERSSDGVDHPRYEIDTYLFRLAAPLGDQAVVANLTYETLSGASPWYVEPRQAGVDDTPVQVMSGASIRENRADVQLTWALPLGGIDWGVSLGYSTEDDYRATSGGIEFEYRPLGSAHSLSGGVGYSYDKIDPVRGARSLDVIEAADKDSLNAFLGVSWVLDARTVLQTAVSYGLHDGFLSDPYKRVYVVQGPTLIADSRPEERQQFTASARLRRYLAGVGAALHADYRYYRDDWQIEAHTVELSWHQALGEHWRVVPGLRWYSQSQAEFYAPYFQTPRSDGLASSDYRLSPYGALTARLDLRRALPGDWEIGIGGEWYEASADYAVSSVAVESPGLVEYLIFNFRLGTRF
ncbi:DUF3570 domain-containing protein [Sinimarinibacterium thermocellulolyticum]|uniref:DUF3570 domain-containing protein n=1 Tax=Sinimarinibacterium thermocellulolyticum TaxID=3170016 RepID=A0ABV2ACG6_9GAMM